MQTKKQKERQNLKKLKFRQVKERPTKEAETHLTNCEICTAKIDRCGAFLNWKFVISAVECLSNSYRLFRCTFVLWPIEKRFAANRWWWCWCSSWCCGLREITTITYLFLRCLSLCVWLSVQHLSSFPIQVFSYIQRKTSSHLFPKRKTDFQVAKLNTTPWDNYVLMLILFCEVCLRKYFCLTKIKRSKQSSKNNKKCTKLLSFTAIPD